jgi:hypothetical protein
MRSCRQGFACFLYALPFVVAIAAFAQTKFPLPAAARGTLAEPDAIVTRECPLNMTVQQQGWGKVEWTVSQEDARAAEGVIRRPSGAGVNVALKAPSGRALRHVELVVYYLEPHGRVLAVPERGGAMPEMKKSFDLSADRGSAGEISRSLLVGAAAGITRVQLMSVKYADGESWSGSGCSVKPSLYMPVGP